MPELIISVDHRLPQGEALRRIQATIAQAKTQYSDKVADFDEEWTSNFGTFEIFAQNLQAFGTVQVNPTNVSVQTTLPIFMFLFK